MNTYTNDSEWVALIKEAKGIGFSIEDIKSFIKGNCEMGFAKWLVKKDGEVIAQFETKNDYKKAVEFAESYYPEFDEVVVDLSDFIASLDG